VAKRRRGLTSIQCRVVLSWLIDMLALDTQPAPIQLYFLQPNNSREAVHARSSYRNPNAPDCRRFARSHYDFARC